MGDCTASSSSSAAAGQLVAEAALGLEEALQVLARTFLERAGMAPAVAEEWARPVVIGGLVLLVLAVVGLSRYLVQAVGGGASKGPRALPKLQATKDDPSHYREGSHNSSLYGGGSRPKHVGILAAEVYFPSTYVRQTLLEKAHGVRCTQPFSTHLPTHSFLHLLS